MVEVVDSPDSALEDSASVTSITKEIVSKGTKYEVEYVTKESEVKKVVVLKDKDNKPVIIDEMPITKDFKPTEPVIVKDKVDSNTKVKTVVYPTVQTFKLDESSQEITQYVEKTVKETQ